MAAPAVSVNATLVEARAEALAWHSPYLFLRNLSVEAQQVRFGTGPALRFAEEKQAEVLPMVGCEGQWLLQGLAWDTEYFGTSTYRLFTGLFRMTTSLVSLQYAAAALRQQLADRGNYYAFTIVPAEDTQLLQALTGGGWQLVETRLNFYCPTTLTLPPPVGVRLARPDEAEYIGQISATARNPYDRFHADPWFGEARADAFLARYAEAAVKGTYANAVLVPDEPGLPIDSFLAIGDTDTLPNLPGSSASRILLTAVGPRNRGWHQKLAAETVRRAAELNLEHVLMTTQATNRAVFRTCEKLGFRLASTMHVLTCNSSANN